MKKSEVKKLTEITVPIIKEALSKKYYQLIAHAIKVSKNIDALALNLADVFGDDNSSFRRDQFLKAAGVKDREMIRPEGKIKEAGGKTDMVCHECGKKFKKKLGPKTVEVKSPKCGGYDTDVA